MAEPASASGITIMAGVGGIASLLPFVNGDALLGAVLGATVVAVYTQNVMWRMKIAGLILSILCGYFFSSDAQVIGNAILMKMFAFQIKSIAVVSCLVAVVSVPFLKKLSEWANDFDLMGYLASVAQKKKSHRSDDQED